LTSAKKLTEAVGKETFYTQGGAVTRAIEFLRVWQLSYNDICDDRGWVNVKNFPDNKLYDIVNKIINFHK